MKHFIQALLFFVTFFISSQLHAQSLINCINGGSASLGDIKHQVRLSCGEPERTELLGFIDKMQNEKRIRVMKIEEWIYSMSFYGEPYFFSLIFEGNKLVEIQKISQK